MPGSVDQIRRYILTGGSAAVLETALFSLLLRSGLPVISAAILSFCVGAVWNYSLSSRFVFRRKWRFKGLLLFFAATPVGLVINTSTSYFALMTLGLSASSAKVLGIGLAFFANFFVNRTFVFKDRDEGDPASFADANESREAGGQSATPLHASSSET